MVYPKNSAKGKAGENYFAYWILRNFGWPCRLLDIDIGIDAQIEVLNGKNRPTGNCLPVQIKTTESKELKLQIDTEHLNQWSMMNESVLLVLIDFKTDTPNIYYKEIQCEDVQSKLYDAKLNNIESKVIWFSEQDLLTMDLKNKITSISYKNLDEITIKNAKHLIVEIEDNKEFFELESGCWGEFDFSKGEYDSVIESYDRCCRLNEKIENATIQLSNLSSVCDSIDTALEEFEYFTSGIKNLLCTLFRTDEKYEHRKGLNEAKRHNTLKNLITEAFE
ncbi:hypothetical protein CGI80_23500 [Vibrio parahaemolyticus]|uniref:DUF4365 domain-containing protein n=1 Tax=Vibrio harveyi group TaxID=717610 RepID=UPI00111DAF8E|nr:MULTISPECIES: DUF4365 domain-containing protein [Vibrio harveyi group]MCS0333161.1 DUF4365 domain-containing protein [Vibrio diabolicus]TOH45468.1 hypothetical protein CGI80_23500 [Vibrio parahaemolyticus]HCE2133700.1 DUF4365 domain-containing protein [Vibrio parahaemolyticus]